MSQIDVRRLYNDGDILLASDLDAFLNDIETFLNITKITDDNIQDGGITASTKLANATITTNKLANNSVTTDKLVDDSVTAAKLADDAVVTANIVDDAVTTAKIADDAVTVDQLADNSVGTAQLIAAAVTSGKIASGALSIQSTTLTSGSSWTVPTGVYAVLVTGCGGGSGGHYRYFDTISAGLYKYNEPAGGGAAPTYVGFASVTPGSTVSYSIGSGGSGGTSSNISGNAGGNTTFGSHTMRGARVKPVTYYYTGVSLASFDFLPGDNSGFGAGGAAGTAASANTGAGGGAGASANSNGAAGGSGIIRLYWINPT